MRARGKKLRRRGGECSGGRHRRSLHLLGRRCFQSNLVAISAAAWADLGVISEGVDDLEGGSEVGTAQVETEEQSGEAAARLLWVEELLHARSLEPGEMVARPVEHHLMCGPRGHLDAVDALKAREALGGRASAERQVGDHHKHRGSREEHASREDVLCGDAHVVVVVQTREQSKSREHHAHISTISHSTGYRTHNI